MKRLFLPFHAALPPRAAPDKVQGMEIEGVQIREAGEQGGAAAMARRFNGVDSEIFINDAGHAAQNLRPDDGRVHPQIRIAFEVAEPMRPPYQPVADEATPIRKDHEVSGLQFVISDGLHFDPRSVSQHGIHTAPLNARDGPPAPPQGVLHVLHGAGKIGI